LGSELTPAAEQNWLRLTLHQPSLTAQKEVLALLAQAGMTRRAFPPVSIAAQNWGAMEHSVIGLEKPRAAPPDHQLSVLQLVERLLMATTEFAFGSEMTPAEPLDHPLSRLPR
jgi:hypothetical protein